MESDERGPVTAVVTRDVIPGRESDYDEWARRVVSASARYGATGHVPHLRSRRPYTPGVDRPVSRRRWRDGLGRIGRPRPAREGGGGVLKPPPPAGQRPGNVVRSAAQA